MSLSEAGVAGTESQPHRETLFEKREGMEGERAHLTLLKESVWEWLPLSFKGTNQVFSRSQELPCVCMSYSVRDHVSSGVKLFTVVCSVTCSK